MAPGLSHDIQIGQLIDRRFEITNLIERSGMATIFKALDCQTRRIVALKFPHLEFEGSVASSARFAHEAAILGKLDHPGILKIIPVTERSRTYIAMEFLAGRTLHEILVRDRPLSECDALRLASRLCGILEYMHSQGIIHRDIKPGNIMISDDGSIHIIDFGIASSPSWTSTKMGTPDYMSPEQIRGDRVDARTDIYSLGVVLYEIVTGVRPLQEHTPAPPRALNSNLSGQIEEIILHAMAPNPSDRYSSVAAMKAELDSPQTVQLTGKYQNPRKASAWPKRLRLSGIVLIIGAVPFLLFYVFLLMFQRQLAR